jgi:hypothetical protein
LADEYGAWEEYLSAIEGQEAVQIIGITDYLSISAYSYIRREKKNGRLSNILFLLPNIEFRVLPQTHKGNAINLHLLINPADLDHEFRINDALSRLNWKYDGNQYCCLPEKLKALGRAHNQEITDEAAALSHGVQQFKIDFTTFTKWYQQEDWLRRNSIVAIAAGEDGLSGLSKDTGWSATREEISRFSQVIFSGAPSDRLFWLGKKGADGVSDMRKLGGPKPCVHGSDAHCIERLFKPDKDRFCWIKGDPTFEGLRQILFEPETRVHIGATRPGFHDQSRVIQEVTIAGSNGWFEDCTIPLNPGLVSIIGQKGSGKSALADLIAYAAGSWLDSDRTSFLNRAREYLRGARIQLIWADGHKSETELFDQIEEQGLVRYLSQRFVERLCAEDYEGNELVDEIESVIFAHLDPTDTLNASSFSELRAIKTEHTKSQMERLRESIQGLIREEFRLRENQKSIPEKKARTATLNKEREGLEKQMPKAETEAEQKLRNDLLEKRESLGKVQRRSKLSCDWRI